MLCWPDASSLLHSMTISDSEICDLVFQSASFRSISDPQYWAQSFWQIRRDFNFNFVHIPPYRFPFSRLYNRTNDVVFADPPTAVISLEIFNLHFYLVYNRSLGLVFEVNDTKTAIDLPESDVINFNPFPCHYMPSLQTAHMHQSQSRSVAWPCNLFTLYPAKRSATIVKSSFPFHL